MTPAVLLLIWFAGLLGACVGSFLNVCIFRMPQDHLSVTRPAFSFCPQCNETIAWYDNIPILSWLALRGRCRCCAVQISPRYALVEGLTAFLFVLAVIELGEPSIAPGNLLAIGFWSILFAVLVVVTFIDIDHRIIPDELSVGGAALAPWAAWLIPGVPIDRLPEPWIGALGGISLGWIAVGSTAAIALQVGAAVGGGALSMALFRRYSPSWDGTVRTWWDTRLAGSVGALVALSLVSTFLVGGWTGSENSPALLGSLLGMGLGAGSIYAMGVFGKLVFRKDAMGFGDVKLMALLGAVLGAKFVLLAIFLACLLGSVFGLIIRACTGSSYMAFGPYLAGGAMILVLWADWVQKGVDWYMSLLRG